MSDSRDTNRDEHVSLAEKIKDKLHLGHKDKVECTSTHQTTTVVAPHATDTHHTQAEAMPGHIPSETRKDFTGSTMPSETRKDFTGSTIPSETRKDFTGSTMPSETRKDFTGSTMPSETRKDFTGSTDPRDINRDGHISTEEQNRTRDLNRHGHLPAEEHKHQAIPLKHEEVTVERRPLTGAVKPGAQIPHSGAQMTEGEVRVPLYHEEIMNVPTEEVIVRKKEVTDYDQAEKTSTGFDDRPMGEKLTQSAFGDARDINHDGHVSMGEKFAHGDSRDTNRDGHVSTGEKLKGFAAGKSARG
jgi:uncharacterized protein (TIGR02271 family)